MRQPSFYEAASDIIAATDLATWKDYLAFQTLDAFAPVMGDEFFQTFRSSTEKSVPFRIKQVDGQCVAAVLPEPQGFPSTAGAEEKKTPNSRLEESWMYLHNTPQNGIRDAILRNTVSVVNSKSINIANLPQSRSESCS